MESVNPTDARRWPNTTKFSQRFMFAGNPAEGHLVKSPWSSDQPADRGAARGQRLNPTNPRR